MLSSKLVPEGLLNAVKSVTTAQQTDAAGNAIEVGTRVRIQDGPYSGQVGTVSEFKSTGRSDVQIEKGPRKAFYNDKLINEALDPVNKKAAKKKFDDREDKDIDNDGDEDESDRYLHKRRKAVGKAIKKTGKGEKVEINPEIEEDVDVAKKKLARAKANLADKKADAHRDKANKMVTKARAMEEVEIEKRKSSSSSDTQDEGWKAQATPAEKGKRAYLKDKGRSDTRMSDSSGPVKPGGIHVPTRTPGVKGTRPSLPSTKTQKYIRNNPQSVSKEEVEWEEAQYWSEETVDDFLKRGGKITKLPSRVARGARKKQTMKLKGGRPGAKELADRAEKKVSKSMGEESEISELDIVGKIAGKNTGTGDSPNTRLTRAANKIEKARNKLQPKRAAKVAAQRAADVKKVQQGAPVNPQKGVSGGVSGAQSKRPHSLRSASAHDHNRQLRNARAKAKRSGVARTGQNESVEISNERMLDVVKAAMKKQVDNERND